MTMPGPHNDELGISRSGSDPGTFRGHRLFATAYATLSGSAEKGPLGEARRRVVQRATGVTVDLGSGTGHNLPHLTDRVTDLHLVEPDPHMVARLRRRAGAAPIHIVGAEDLPFADGSVDTVISTLTLCSVQEPAKAAAEIRRVLRPGGQLLVLEHVRSSAAAVARRQERWNRWWGLCAGGCHLDRDTDAVLRHAGMEAIDVGQVILPGPAVTSAAIAGLYGVGG